MPIRYDKNADTLTIVLDPGIGEIYEIAAGDYSVLTDDNRSLVEIEISHAGRFVRQVLATGIQVPGAPEVEPQERVWHRCDSSMISGFGYDEAEGVLEVAFHRTGTYHYFDVPRHVYEGLLAADSKGRYMRDMIIASYTYVQR